ncbi:MAG: sporulation protein YqfD [Clostridiales bacterium]|jgi:similar to stage IV sporulation protein|nr:sporulation protein YqfD [Clostridiales bacterium]
MILDIWQNLRGYVTIEASGFNVERLINMAARKGVYLWDVTRTSKGVRMNVSVKGFKALTECVRKTKVRVRIKQKAGLPFVLHKYRKRKALLGGIAFCALLLYTLSCFVWLIDIKGNNRVSHDDIIAFCAEQGLQIGAFKYKIDNRKLKTNMMNHFGDISWLDVSIKGTRAVIQIAETIPAPEIVDKTTLCDIVAAKDGLITSIVTGAGTPQVKQNDVVKAGDILVKGQVRHPTDDGGFITKDVRAYAEVWAKMYTPINLEVPLSYDAKEYTTKTSSQYSVSVFGHMLTFFRFGPEYVNYDKSTALNQLNFGEDYPLPIILYKHTFSEFVPTVKTRTIDEAKELAKKMINNRIIREFDFSADILEKSVAFQETPTAVIVNAIITTNERIDQECAPSESLQPSGETDINNS